MISPTSDNPTINPTEMSQKELRTIVDENNYLLRSRTKKSSETLIGEPEGKEEAVSRDGSFFGALFNMINGPLGAGMLSFPYTFYCTGVITGLLLSFLVIIFSTVSLITLAKCSFYKHKDFKQLHGQQSYQQCVYEHLGPFWKRVCELILLVYGSCVLVIYYVVLGQFIKPVVDTIAPGDNFYNSEKMIIIFFAIIFIFPLFLLREIKKLGFSSFLSVVASFYLVVFVVGWGIYKISLDEWGPGQKKLIFFQTESYTGTAYPILFIAIPMKMSGYMCHVLQFPVSYELKGGSTRKMSVIIVIAVTVVSCIYLTLGLFGWFAFGETVKDNLLNNFPGTSILGNIGRLALGSNLVFSLPIQHYSARLAIMSFFWGEKKRFGTFTYLIITVLYFFLCIIISLFVPALSILFGFVGATCCVTFMFFFPAMMIWKTFAKYERKWRFVWYALAILFFFFWAFFGITGCVASTLKLLNNYNVIGSKK